jgi:hypothetical protein
MRSRLIPFLLLSSACGTGPKADWASLLEERDSLAERRRLYGRLSQKPREKEDQDPSSAKTALATAWPLVPAAQPA